MTDNPGGLPSAGWYPDPYGAPYERWWDGAQWTEHTTTPAAAEPAQPIYQAPVEPVQPVYQAPVEPAVEQPSYEQPAYEQPSYQQPAYEQPSYQEPSYQQPTYEQPSYQEPASQTPAFQEPAYQEPAQQQSYEQPAYEEPEYELTYEATQQQPSPAWGTPVSAAAATPASFDDLFGLNQQATAPEAQPEASQPQSEPFSFGAPAAASTAQPAYEAPTYQPQAYEAPQAPSYEAPQAPSYEAPQAPSYEPQAPSYEAPTYEAPSYEAPPAEVPAYEPPPAATTPFDAPYGAPTTEAPSWGEPAPAATAPAAGLAFDDLFGIQSSTTAPQAESSQSASDLFGVPPAAASAAVQQQRPTAGSEANNDAFGALLSGQSAAAGQSGGDEFSSWSNEDYVEPARNGAATASVVFGVLSFLLVGLGGLLGIVFGALGILRANRFAADGDGPVGRTKSIVGIVLSLIGSAVSVALLLFVLPGILNPSAAADTTTGATTDASGSSIVAAAPATANGNIALAVGETGTITFPDTTDPSIQFSVTAVTVNPTCTADPEQVLSPENGQFIGLTMTFTTSADYAGQMATGGLLRVSPTDFVGYLPDGTTVPSSNAGSSCVPETEQFPDAVPAGETVTATVILDLSEATTSFSFSPDGVTGLDTAATRWEWAIPR